MNNFEEIKNEILKRAHTVGACVEQYRRALNNESIEKLCDVIKDNFHWCCVNSVIDGYLIDKYKDDFAQNYIYHNISITSGFLLASGNSTVDASDSSTVEASGNSYIICNSTIECTLNELSIVRRWDTNTIQYVSDSLKFEKL